MRFRGRWLLILVLLMGCMAGVISWQLRQNPLKDSLRKAPKPPTGLSVVIKTAGLPPEARQHGQQQLAQMLKDRPAMQGFVQAGDSIWEWCVRQFAREAAGEPVEWHSEPPEGMGIQCDSLYPKRGRRGFIRIRQSYPDGKDRPGEDLWADAVYELNNLHNSKQFQALDRQAWEGKIEKAEWVRGTLRLEYGTMQRTRNIYQTLWQPLMQARGISTKSYIYRWGIWIPHTFQEWMVELTSGPDNAVEYYSKVYDEKFAVHVRALGQK